MCPEIPEKAALKKMFVKHRRAPVSYTHLDVYKRQVSLGVEDLILSSLFGGAIFGVGIGMVFMARATTGGTDLVAALIQHYLRHYSIVQIMQILSLIHI